MGAAPEERKPRIAEGSSPEPLDYEPHPRSNVGLTDSRMPMWLGLAACAVAVVSLSLRPDPILIPMALAGGAVGLVWSTVVTISLIRYSFVWTARAGGIVAMIVNGAATVGLLHLLRAVPDLLPTK
jgi:hypothetical protein